MANRCQTTCTITGPDSEIDRLKQACFVTVPPPRPGYDYGNGIDFERAEWKATRIFESIYYVQDGQHLVCIESAWSPPIAYLKRFLRCFRI